MKDDATPDTVQDILSQPVAKGRRPRASREDINPKLNRGPASSPGADAADADGGAKSSLSSVAEEGNATGSPLPPVHDDVRSVRHPARASEDGETAMARLSKGRKERESREEFNLKQHRPPAKASSDVS